MHCSKVWKQKENYIGVPGFTYSLLVYGLSLRKSLPLTLEMILKILKDRPYISGVSCKHFNIFMSGCIKQEKVKGLNMVSASLNLCTSDIVLYLVEF